MGWGIGLSFERGCLLVVFFVYNALLHLKCNAKASVKGHLQAVVELLRKGEPE